MGVGVVLAGLLGAALLVDNLGSDKNAGAPTPGGAGTIGSDVFAGGKMLIADRGNNRLLLVNPQKKVLWRYPGPGRPAPKGGFYFPDDAFFTHNGTGIIINQEENDTLLQLSYPQGKITFQYGHPRRPGSGPGFLHQPDDSYLLKDGTITVADALNCRILFLSPAGKKLSQIGSPGNCTHNPPRSINYPNGDTPLPNGHVLVSEVNGSYVDEFTRTGKLVWSTKLPISYPSDPQQLGPNRYLLADYAKPGGVFEFNRQGKILWSYFPKHGNAMLDHPSLAERLPNGLIGVNDDFRHRVVLIDPKRGKIVWQYGHTDHSGTKPGYLKIPDGFDMLGPGGAMPTHPYTG